MDLSRISETPVFKRELGMHLVGTKQLGDYWSLAAGLLHRDASLFEYMTLADIYVEVCQGRYQLWLFSDEFETFACAVTELRIYPQTKVMNIIHASAIPCKDAFDLIGTFYEMLEQWAMQQGAQISQIPCGRKGWERVLKDFGYKFKGIVLQKQLKPVKEH